MEPPGEAAATGHGIVKKNDPIGLAMVTSVDKTAKGVAILVIDTPAGKVVGASATIDGGVLGVGVITCACGGLLTLVLNNLPTATDGAFADDGGTNGTLNFPVIAYFNDTEIPITPKDVLVIVTHGLCVLNGATTTNIKKGKLGCA